MSQSRTAGPVRIVGTGLLGTSIGLALTGLGVAVELADASPSSLELAIDYGAGVRAEPGSSPALIVVCVPPDVTAADSDLTKLSPSALARSMGNAWAVDAVTLPEGATYHQQVAAAQMFAWLRRDATLRAERRDRRSGGRS